VNSAIKKMYESGEAKNILQKNFGSTSFKYDDKLPTPEPCK
jgi:hypothetical protein